MNAHFQQRKRTKLFQLAPKLRASLMALLALVAICVSIVPCEATSLESAETQLVSDSTELPASPEEPSSDCADNCPCLCAGSCSGALVPQLLSLVTDHRSNELVTARKILFARLIPERLFHPPRLQSVV